MARKMINVICEKCKKEFPVRPDRVKKGEGRFCSRSCASYNKAKIRHEKFSQEGDKNPNWKGGCSSDNIKRNEKAKVWKEANKDKVKAHHAISSRVRSGTIKKPTKCSLCNSNENIEAHHEDYSKPLDVIWLCRVCHRNIHRKNPTISVNLQKADMTKRYTEKEISEFLKNVMPKQAPTANAIVNATGISEKTLRDLRDFPEKNRNTKTLDKLSKYMEESKL